jgi:septum formation inhibitor MinC
MALGAWPLGAQEPKKADTPPAAAPVPVSPARRAVDQVRRVPAFFGQIGLTADQREEIYKIRAKHLQRIGDLEKQIAQIRAEMQGECEKLLNDTQKQLLESRRRSAAEKKKARTPAPEPPASTKPADKAAH